MRQIKFRGRRLDNGKWIYGYLADGYYINDINAPVRTVIEVDSHTVGQFTGLLDRNGKEIYEGDILNNYDEPNPLTVKWDEGGCFFGLFNEEDYCECDFISLEVRLGVVIDAEIIGNIHEQ